MFKYFFLFLSLCIISNIKTISQTSWNAKLEVEGNYYDERDISISVYKNDKIEYTISKKLIPHYSIPAVQVMANGNLAVIHSLEGIVEIFDRNQTRLFEHSFYTLPPYREQKMQYVIHDGGTVITVSEKNNNDIYLLSIDGVIVFEDKLNPGIITGLSSSNDAGLISYSTVEWIGNQLNHTTFFIDKTNKLKFSIPVSFELGKFIGDKSQFLGMDKKNMFLIDTEDKIIIWQKTLKTDEIFIDVISNDTNVYFIQGSEPSLIEGAWISEKIKVIKKYESGEEKVIRESLSLNSNLELVVDSGKISIFDKASKSLIKIE